MVYWAENAVDLDEYQQLCCELKGYQSGKTALEFEVRNLKEICNALNELLKDSELIKQGLPNSEKFFSQSTETWKTFELFFGFFSGRTKYC